MTGTDTRTAGHHPAELTEEQFKGIAQNLRNANEDNLLVGSFAAELVGESYPFSKSMAKILFDKMSDVELGERFVRWLRSLQPESLQP